MTIALVDADIVAYRAAASCKEDDEQDIALIRTDKTMQEIMSDVGATGHKVFLSGSRETNFRYKVSLDYKANRVDMVRPVHLEAAKMFLVTQWGAEVCTGYEADDGLGMAQKPSGTTICSIDKDLLMIPGSHWNFVKKEHRIVTPEQGLRAFYTQLLTGDVSDNVIGLRGIGPVKAARILDAVAPDDWYLACLDAYSGDKERMHKNGKLLWIFQKENDIWQPPKDEKEPVQQSGTPLGVRDLVS